MIFCSCFNCARELALSGGILELVNEPRGFESFIVNFVESRDPRARDRLLVGERRVPDGPTVPFPDVRECELVEDRARLRAGADRRMQQRVVRDHQDVVLGHLQVHLERVYPFFDGVLESR